MSKREKRIFIAVNLPEELKDKIEKILEEIRYQFSNDVRFIERENWHITLSFLGSQGDEAIGEVVGAMDAVAARFSPPKIEFTDLGYGPVGKSPRMIWLNCSVATAKELQPIKDQLENNELIDRNIKFKREYRQLRVHVTLARFESGDDLPDIQRSFTFRFAADSIDLMESQLGPAGVQYELLQKIKFRHNI